MALRDIVQDGNDILRKICRPITVFDGKLAKILDDMHATMRYAEGCGLAAPQIGILRRMAVVEVDDFYVELINPQIVSCGGEQISTEACLSVKGKQCLVKRPKKIVVDYQDRNGQFLRLEAEDYIARACCHEMDHLDGILFYDKAYKGKIEEE